MEYKAIIFDLDGTAITNAQHSLPSKRLIEAIRNAKEFFRICAATGRPISNAKHLLDALELVDPCVISAGTEVVNPQTDEIMWKYDIETNDSQKILEICKPYSYELLVNDEGIGGGDQANKRMDIPKQVNVMYLMQVSLENTKIIMRDLASIQNITASEVPSWTGKNIDIHITHRDATKEHAIAKVLKILDITQDETIGIGDGNNDVHLFRAVGMKVAMGNATDLLKSQADIVCDTVENDGLAKFIEEQIAAIS